MPVDNPKVPLEVSTTTPVRPTAFGAPTARRVSAPAVPMNLAAMESAKPDSLLESIRSLPPLPAAVSRLVALAQDPDADFAKIARVIETDQMLTARTLRAANSPLYGVSRRVQTVRTATVLLGRTAILGMAVAFSMEGMQKSMEDTWPIDPTLFWRHNLGVALTSRALAKHYGLPDPEEAYVAGLLHDIGKLVMLNHFGDAYSHLLQDAQRSTKPLFLLERQAYETDHAASGHALCLHWHIPHSLARAVAKHHDEDDRKPDSVANIIRQANTLVKMIHLGESGNRFVKLRSFDEIPRPWLQQMLLDLPRTVGSAETLFTATEEGQALPAPPAARPIVHLQITEPEEERLLSLLLLSMGYEPLPLFEDFSLDTPEDAGSLAGIITDVPLPPVRQIAYRQSNAPVMDYALWRSEKEMPTGSGYLHIGQLQCWLKENLPGVRE